MELRLHVRVTPKAARTAINGWTQDAAGNRVLKVGVTAAPEKGKANKALVDFLAESWALPRSAITVVKGETDRNKIIALQGVSKMQIDKILS